MAIVFIGNGYYEPNFRCPSEVKFSQAHTKSVSDRKKNPSIFSSSDPQHNYVSLEKYEKILCGHPLLSGALDLTAPEGGG